MKNRISAIFLGFLIAALIFSGYGVIQPAIAQASADAKVSKLAMDYFANLPQDRNMVQVKDFFTKINAKENMLIVDIRTAADYEKGHIIGAINLPYGKAIAENLEILPAKTPILVYCYTGQTSGQTIALLNIAGKNAKSVAGGFNRGISRAEGFEQYINTEKVALPTKKFKTDKAVKAALTKYYTDAAARAGTNTGNMNMSPANVKTIIDNKDTSYYILSVRTADDYKKGDIPTAANIPFGKGMEQKFANLPKDKKIIVSCYSGQTGSQVVAILRVLGYDAYNLNSGIGRAEPKSGWLGEGFPVSPGTNLFSSMKGQMINYFSILLASAQEEQKPPAQPDKKDNS